LAKMILFDMSNGTLSLHSIDKVYFTLALTPIGAIVIFSMCMIFGCDGIANEAITSMFGCGYMIAWLIVPSAYTAYTVNEMGNIPFTCPDSYNYSLPLLHTTCQIRATNLIFIWAYPTFLVFSSILLVNDDNNNENEVSDICEIPFEVVERIEDVVI
ncbi:547_t:CDS:2, partial [Ambispora leptoticha]